VNSNSSPDRPPSRPPDQARDAAIGEITTGASEQAARQRLDGCSPFDPGNHDAYGRWRDNKLAKRPQSAAELAVEVADLASPSAAEQEAIIARIRATNMAVYASQQSHDEHRTRQQFRSFAAAFGLHESEAHRSATSDGIVALEVVSKGPRLGYIPYTSKPLSWHTDGYYNAPDAMIRAFILHCHRDASSGGENGLLDPEIAYIRLRDRDPGLIAALMRPDAMTIPSNTEKDGSIRATSVGPVFSVDPATGALQMRYSARARNIIWRDDDQTGAAARALLELLQAGDDVIKHRLSPGEGLICNNVIHNRSGFAEDPDIARRRLYFRSRFTRRVRAT